MNESSLARQLVDAVETPASDPPMTQEQLRQVVMILAGTMDDTAIARRVELPVDLVCKWIAEGTHLE